LHQLPQMQLQCISIGLGKRQRRSQRKPSKNDPHAPAVFIEGLHIVGRPLVTPSMVFVSMRELQKRAVKLLDVVLRERKVAPGIEHEPRCFRIAGNLFFVPRPERPEIDSRISTSRSVSFAPSIRVDAPTDSTVAILRNVARRSGARVPSALHAPLNSSISPTKRRRSGVSTRFLKGSSGIPAIVPENTRCFVWVFPGRIAGIGGLASKVEKSRKGIATKSTKGPRLQHSWAFCAFCGYSFPAFFHF